MRFRLARIVRREKPRLGPRFRGGAPAPAGAGSLLSLPAPDPLEDARRVAHALHHPLLEAAAALVEAAGAGEHALRLLLVARGEERHAEVGERVRRGAELARAVQEVD